MSHLYDRATALDTFGNDEALFAEIGGIFVADWPSYRAKMRAALATGDAAMLRHASLAVKDLVAYFAAEKATHAVRELERAGCFGRLEHASRLLDAAIFAIDELAAALTVEARC